MHAPSSPMRLPEAQDRDRGADHLAPDCAGQNFYAIDRGLRDLLRLYLVPEDFRRLEPHFDRLGVLAGGKLDELARAADKHPPVLNPRDRFGRDQDWIDYHSSYREMEKIAFGDFQFHAMSHRAGTLRMDRPLPAVAKYALQYLFVQAEFGLMCPISVTDTSIHLIRKFASPELRDYLLPKMLSDDLATLWKGTQFMTERAGGSDVGAIETVARCEDGVWRLFGDKWFCSHADADVALLLARPEGAAAGTSGAGAVCAAAPAQGRQPQRLPHRSPQGQTGHPLDGERRNQARGRGRLSGRRSRSRPQADDGAGQPVAAFPWRSRCRDDAALRQRGADLRADPVGIRQEHHRISAAAAPASEDRRALGTGAVDVPVCRKRDGSRQCRLGRGRKPVADLSRRCSSSAPAATTFRSPPGPWKSAAATATSRNGCMRG